MNQTHQIDESNYPLLTWADVNDQVDRAMAAMVLLMEPEEQGRAYIKP